MAYNWRDEFLASIGGDDGANPRYTDAYGQLDATASYAFNENLTVSFEALNLLDNHTRQHSREYHQLINYTETGARYNVGVRYTFLMF